MIEGGILPDDAITQLQVENLWYARAATDLYDQLGYPPRRSIGAPRGPLNFWETPPAGMVIQEQP